MRRDVCLSQSNMQIPLQSVAKRFQPQIIQDFNTEVPDMAAQLNLLKKVGYIVEEM